MGWHSQTIVPGEDLGEFLTVEEKSTVIKAVANETTEIIKIKINGRCRMCEKEFDLELTSTNGGSLLEYACICGYFRYMGWNDEVIWDSHNVPKEIWVQRRFEHEMLLEPHY